MGLFPQPVQPLRDVFSCSIQFFSKLYSRAEKRNEIHAGFRRRGTFLRRNGPFPQDVPRLSDNARNGRIVCEQPPWRKPAQRASDGSPRRKPGERIAPRLIARLGGRKKCRHSKSEPTKSTAHFASFSGAPFQKYGLERARLQAGPIDAPKCPWAFSPLLYSHPKNRRERAISQHATCETGAFS